MENYNKMERKIKLQLSDFEFFELCEYLENIVEVFPHEMIFDFLIRLKAILRPRKVKTTIAMNIKEAAMLYFITKFDYHSVLANVAMSIISEQIREEIVRYLTEAELQMKCSNKQ